MILALLFSELPKACVLGGEAQQISILNVQLPPAPKVKTQSIAVVIHTVGMLQGLEDNRISGAAPILNLSHRLSIRVTSPSDNGLAAPDGTD